MKKTLIIIFTLFIGFYSFSHEKPKLVVGIVVDQMRYDYIYRFWQDFGDDGFKKLINEGHFFRNCQFGYVLTYTGPGHASIFTGTTHGSCYSYDTHVPLIFFGGKIPQGQTDRKVNIRDIAPTISTIFGISFPNGCTGNPLPEVTQ